MAIRDESFSDAIERLRQQHTDDGDYEAKSCSRKLSASVWDSVSAFANTDGGTLLLGVDENTGFTVAKDFNIDKIRDQFCEGIGDGSNNGVKIHPVPSHRIHRESLDGEQVLVVQINENQPTQKPCYVLAKGIAQGSYKRSDDKDVPLDPGEVYELQNVLKPSNTEMKIVEQADITDLDATIIHGILSRLQGSKALRGTNSEEEKLSRIHITDKQGNVLFAGLLVTGKYPQQFYPRLVIDVAAHAGTSKAEAGSPRFLDHHICEGTIPEMIDEAIGATVRNLRTYSVVEGSGRRDLPEIPPEVLREAIANAVIHRKYHPYFQGQPVSVDIYSDRVEITNPGGLWGGKTLETLNDGRSMCRNGALMRLVQNAEIPHKDTITVEGQGTGIELMIHEMESRALRKPDFDASADSFMVTLWRSGAELNVNQQWIRQQGSPTSRKDEALLLCLREWGPSHVHDIRDRLKYDSDDIRDHFHALEQRNMVQEIHKDVFALVNGDTNIPVSPIMDKETGIRSGEMDYINLSAKEAILNAFQKSLNEPRLTMKELSDITGKSLSALRQAMPALIAEGTMTAIGKPHSRSRSYMLATPRK